LVRRNEQAEARCYRRIQINRRSSAQTSLGTTLLQPYGFLRSATATFAGRFHRE
jgi:hypothetical protein